MRKPIIHLSLGLVVAVAVLVAGSAAAAIDPRPPKSGSAPPGASGPAIAIQLRATLSASQVPSLQVASTASGRFLGALIRSGFGAKPPATAQKPTLSWSLFWAISVSNTTGPVTGIEIRSGEVRAASSAPFLKLCGPCTSTSRAGIGGAAGTTLLSGTLLNLTSAQVAALRRADLYVNVLTAANPSGELRGPITRRKPVTPNVPPNRRMPNPLKPTPGQQIPTPLVKIPG